MLLAAYLHAGGDPHAASRGRGWALLHLATGCALIDSGVVVGLDSARPSFAVAARPEPESPDGFATCVSLLLVATPPSAKPQACQGHS